MSDYGNIFLEIGRYPDEFTAEHRHHAALAFRLTRERYPSAKIGFMVGGYDSYPAELYDIPQAKEYICLWAHEAGLSDWRDAVKVPWEPVHCLGILQLCGVFAADSPITVSTPSGLRRS